MLQASLANQETVPVVLRVTRSMRGLCRTCANAEGCTFPRNPSRPVWSCEEFQGENVDPTDPPTLEGRRIPELMCETPELKGLCRDCANQTTCRYPRPEGGVWQCEELA